MSFTRCELVLVATFVAVLLSWHNAYWIDYVLLCGVYFIACRWVIVLQNYLSKSLLIKVAWFWGWLLGLRFLPTVGVHSFNPVVIYNISRLSVLKCLLTCRIAVRGVESVNNLINNLRSTLFTTDWWRLLVVLDVHRLETTVLVELRNDVALIWVDFCVDMTLIWFSWHGLVATDACGLTKFLLSLFWRIQKVICNYRIITWRSF